MYIVIYKWVKEIRSYIIDSYIGLILFNTLFFNPWSQTMRPQGNVLFKNTFKMHLHYLTYITFRVKKKGTILQMMQYNE